MLNGVKHDVNDNNSSTVRLPPGLAAFVNDANRANTHYSLKALIRNSNYNKSGCALLSSSSLGSDSSISSSAASNNHHDEIESLTAHSEELERERLRLENELFCELKKKFALTTDDDEKEEEKRAAPKKKKVAKNGKNSEIIVAMREIIEKNNQMRSVFTEDDITEFIEHYSEDISWKSFDDNDERKKMFAHKMRNYFFDNKNYFISYGQVIKIWRAMNKMYIASHIDWQQIAVSHGWRDRSLIYISERVTKDAIASGLIFEEFRTSKQLFHYLRWTIKMQQIDGYFRVFRNHENRNNELVLFNIELHANNEYQSDLYIVGQENDKITPKSPRWKMTQFMTAKEIFNRYRIKYCKLPPGSRTNCDGFKRFVAEKSRRFLILSGYIRGEHIADINVENRIIMCCYAYYDPFVSCNNENNYYYFAAHSIQNISCDIYCKLPQIKTQQKKENHKKKPNEMVLCWTSFYQQICSAINSNQIQHNFVRIVSFDKHKTAYFIDALLPIRLADNNWCGIIFRDALPLSICIDCTDIKTKSKLYDAAQNHVQYEWMHNEMTRLTLIQMVSPPLPISPMNPSYHHHHHHRYNNNNYKHRLVLKQAMMYR